MSKICFLSLIMILNLSLSAQAAEKSTPKAEAVAAKAALLKEQREAMAKAHEKMAACLRTDQSLAECRSEMRETCMSAMGGKGCPMMAGHKGRMHDWMDYEESSEKESLESKQK